MRNDRERSRYYNGIKFLCASGGLSSCAVLWLYLDRPFIGDAPRLIGGLASDGLSRIFVLACLTFSCVLYGVGHSMKDCSEAPPIISMKDRLVFVGAKVFATLPIFAAITIIGTGLLFPR